MNEQRNSYLDGLRGLASVTVVFYHYLLSFYPAIFTLQPRDSHTPQNTEANIGSSVLSFLFNGNFAVCLFFVLSGYVLSLKFYAENNFSSPVSGASKRYIRLVIPISISVIISCIILLFDGYSNIATANNSTLNTFWFSKLWNIKPHFLDMFKEGFIDSVFYGGTLEYNPVLWTMNIEFKGSLLVYAFLALFGRTKNRFVIYFILIILFYKSYFLAFILGMGLCDYRFGKYYRPVPVYISTILLLIALYSGSFELISVNPKSGWGLLDRSYAEQNQIVFIMAALLMLVSLIHEKRFQIFLSKKWLVFLGKISFSLYLLHLIVLGSFTCFTFNFFHNSCNLNYHISFSLAFLLSFTLLMIVSYSYYKYVDLKAIKLADKVYTRFLNPAKTDSKPDNFEGKP